MLGIPLRGSENTRASTMYFRCKKCQSFLLCILAFSIKQDTGFKYKHCTSYICEGCLLNMLQH